MQPLEASTRRMAPTKASYSEYIPGGKQNNDGREGIRMSSRDIDIDIANDHDDDHNNDDDETSGDRNHLGDRPSPAKRNVSTTTSEISQDKSSHTDGCPSSGAKLVGAEASAVVGAAPHKNTAKYKKAPEAPKRFKPAFIFFSAVKHKEIRAQMGDSSSNQRTANISKLVSEAWKGLAPQERSKWETMARHDKARYDIEKSLYRGPWRVPKKRKAKDVNAPKRPMSAFLAFANCRRAEVKSRLPEASNGDISRALATMWRDAPEEIRQRYIQEENEKRKKYLQNMAEWKEKSEEGQRLEQQQREDISMLLAEGAEADGDGGDGNNTSGNDNWDPHHRDEPDESQRQRYLKEQNGVKFDDDDDTNVSTTGPEAAILKKPPSSSFSFINKKVPRRKSSIASTTFAPFYDGSQHDFQNHSVSFEQQQPLVSFFGQDRGASLLTQGSSPLYAYSSSHPDMGGEPQTYFYCPPGSSSQINTFASAYYDPSVAAVPLEPISNSSIANQGASSSASAVAPANWYNPLGLTPNAGLLDTMSGSGGTGTFRNVANNGYSPMMAQALSGPNGWLSMGIPYGGSDGFSNDVYGGVGGGFPTTGVNSLSAYRHHRAGLGHDGTASYLTTGAPEPFLFNAESVAAPTNILLSPSHPNNATSSLDPYSTTHASETFDYNEHY